ncbi:Recombination/repair protein Rad50 [Macrophomina phaseolina MS6]|uniref:DNA repair protein RAD50 n=1 Tax=Macrophomina phaseolina (strain MS6) TaxID=1126212 RepID=K2RM80_MACPH|nr:Recombination/repair protein Rad50 [Macrophomina phaseolina MS6]
MLTGLRSVRSFDNRVSETIQFYSPLTLIVGFNGSGKTTIIECLKYATTGELPPNSDRGKSFIHDPNLCGEKEVLAQVKMSFKATSGVKMVSTRSLQLTVKKSGQKINRTVKALEGQLLMVKDGERTAISSRVAELNQIMPQYLGISPAILEYVIFCHQEDSMWPMSEPGALKKRFDEIFEAEKYTKAIENIKLLQKRQKEELGKLKIIEEHAKQDKDKGERAEKRSTELYEEIEQLQLKVEKIEEERKDVEQRAKEAWDRTAQFENIIAQLNGKRIKAATLESNVKDIQENIKEMMDTDEELEEHLSKYEERVQLYNEEQEEKLGRYKVIAEDIKRTDEKLGEKRSEIGRHEANKEAYERQLESRETLVKETAHRLEIRGFDLEINDDQVREFMLRLNRLAKEQQTALERARMQKQEELKVANKELSQATQRKTTLEESKKNHRTQIATNDQKLSELQQQIDKIVIDEGRKATLEASLEDIDRRLGKAKDDFSAAEWEAKLTAAKSQERDFDEQKARLDAEMVEASQMAKELAQLHYVRKLLKDTQTKLTTNTAAHREHISKIIGQSWELSTLEMEFNAVLAQRSKDLQESMSQRDGTSRELEQLQFKLNSVKTELSKKHSELKINAEHLDQILADEETPEDFPEALNTATKSVEIAQRDVALSGTMEKFFTDCLETFRKHDMCQLCYRGFKQNDPERPRFPKRLEAKIQQAVDENFEQTLKEHQAELEKLRGAQPAYNTWVRLKSKEIPELEAMLRDLESRRESLVRVIEGQDERVVECRGLKRDVDFITQNVTAIIEDVKAIRGYEAEIEELSQKQQHSGTFRSIEQIQVDIQRVNDQSKTIKNTITQLSKEMDRSREKIRRLENEVRDVRAEITTAVYALREKNGLISQAGDRRNQNTERREFIRQTDQELEDLFPKLEQAQAKCDAIQTRGDKKEQEIQETRKKITDSLDSLRKASAEINAYLENGGTGQLTTARQELENLQAEKQQLEKEQKQLTSDINKIKEQLRNHTDTRREIQDNLRYRISLRKLEAVRQQIQELEEHNAEADRDRCQKEANAWQRKRERLAAESATLVGEARTKDEQLKRFLEEWDTDYKDAAKNYKEAHIKVETTKAACEDLGRYGGALDKAIVKYHSLKLEEINRIIEELWRKTYQGTDVDTIMIRSENETSNKTRSYNYRVVMVKQDAEMDMRGRCSAGQKVLASIIIRLALAECFGVNCGLIALDEPTTNLDRDNIRALAESLAEIIRVRRQQSNFQLIVITHDEEFLRYMQCAEFSDYYYRVSRNEKQKSTIEKQSIAEVL